MGGLSPRILFEANTICTLRDGVRLASDIYRPDDRERHPVLLSRTPYDKRAPTGSIIDPLRMAEAGYVVVMQDVRGRFASEGTFLPYLTEAEDGYDAVEWAASQPWSDGNVGMFGVSYLAQVQLMAASLQPPSLRAIVPIQSPAQTQGADRHRGGAMALGLLGSWSSAVALAELFRRVRADRSMAREIPRMVDDLEHLDEVLRRTPLLPFAPLEHGLGEMAVFFERSVRRDPSVEMKRFRVENILVPAMVVAGWHDLFLQTDLDQFVALRESAGSDDARRLTRLMVGPWSHGTASSTVGEIDYGMRASSMLIDLREDVNALHLRWFDARLRGVDTGIDSEAPVRLFVMGQNRWRDAPGWPVESIATAWNLHGEYRGTQPPSDAARVGGRGLGPVEPVEAPPSSFDLVPHDPVITHGGSLLMASRYIKGPVNQLATEIRDDVLVFTSEPLREPLTIIGRVVLEAWVATDAEDTDVVARLCDVHPDGTSYNVCGGILRMSSVDDEGGRPGAGEPARVEVDLWSTAHAFLPGHRLRVHVCASDFPRYDRNPGVVASTADITQVLPQHNRLFHAPAHPTRIWLPGVER